MKLSLKKRNFLLTALLFFASLLVSLAIIEICIRLSGKTTWSEEKVYHHCPIMTMPDEEIGWINKPGVYKYSTTNDGRNVITVTIDQDSARGVTKEESSKPEIWFFGGSFTFAWSITDGGDYPSQIGQQLPQFRIRNFGAPGYGTLQSYMLFRRLLQTSGIKPVLVVYGFVFTHGSRNVANHWWLYNIRRAEGEQAWAETPYARLDESGSYKIYPPKKYSKWPLSQYFATINLIQDCYNKVDDDNINKQISAVTAKTLNDWNHEARTVKAKFLVYNIWIPPKSGWRGVLRKNKILSIDPVKMFHLSPRTTISGDPNHPNIFVHRYWADYFIKTVKFELEKKK